jgi:hypothetical protein
MTYIKMIGTRLEKFSSEPGGARGHPGTTDMGMGWANFRR